MSSINHINNDYYKKFDQTVSDTHSWRKLATSLPQLAEYLKDSQNLRILDIGCGPGSITYDTYVNYGTSNEVVGIDTVPELISECKSRYVIDTNNERNNTLNFKQGSIYNIPVPDNSFDVVYCHQVLIHLEDPDTAMREMSRVLKKKTNSKLFICECQLDMTMAYPYLYNETLKSYFHSQKSTFSKEDYGLSLKESFKNAVTNHEFFLKLHAVTWCISSTEERELFANMYMKRIEHKDNIEHKEEYMKIWTDWKNNDSSVLIMMSCLLEVTHP